VLLCLHGRTVLMIILKVKEEEERNKRNSSRKRESGREKGEIENEETEEKV
jgi:hypothetical protein